MHLAALAIALSVYTATPPPRQTAPGTLLNAERAEPPAVTIKLLPSRAR